MPTVLPVRAFFFPSPKTVVLGVFQRQTRWSNPKRKKRKQQKRPFLWNDDDDDDDDDDEMGFVYTQKRTNEVVHYAPAAHGSPVNWQWIAAGAMQRIDGNGIRALPEKCSLAYAVTRTSFPNERRRRGRFVSRTARVARRPLSRNDMRARSAVQLIFRKNIISRTVFQMKTYRRRLRRRRITLGS